jgi:hypothetical protein
VTLKVNASIPVRTGAQRRDGFVSSSASELPDIEDPPNPPAAVIDIRRPWL